MDEQVIVHCPACGVAFTVTPRLKNVTRGHVSLFFAFDNAVVDHKCESD